MLEYLAASNGTRDRHRVGEQHKLQPHNLLSSTESIVHTAVVPLLAKFFAERAADKRSNQVKCGENAVRLGILSVQQVCSFLKLTTWQRTPLQSMHLLFAEQRAAYTHQRFWYSTYGAMALYSATCAHNQRNTRTTIHRTTPQNICM